MYFQDLLGLFLPRLCLACGRALFKHEDYVCSLCWMSLPRTLFHQDPDNQVNRVFWGRAWLEQATACFYYSKGNKVQRLIHQLKYKGQQELGVYMGRMYGRELVREEVYRSADLLLPVPLHPKKQRSRGYNQSEAIAKGLSLSLEIPVETQSLVRTRATDTQTRKSRYHRWQNVEDLFQLTCPEQLENKYVLLVDDVITTGSTLESCIHAVQQAPGVRVSVVALAFSST